MFFRRKPKEEEKEFILEEKYIQSNIELRNYVRKILLKETKKVVLLENYIETKIKFTKMAKQAKIEDIMIPIFDGENYSGWKVRLSTLLEYKECHEPAKSGITDKYKDKEAEWRKWI